LGPRSRGISLKNLRNKRKTSKALTNQVDVVMYTIMIKQFRLEHKIGMLVLLNCRYMMGQV
jgi:hypothetical protein